MLKQRPSWDEYFLKLAHAAAERSTCPRANVGVILVQDRKILATGYNGAPTKMVDCLENGCVMIDNHCVRSIHAEANALFHAPELTDYTIMYCTHQPCMECCKLIVQKGVKRVIYDVVGAREDSRSVLFGYATQNGYLHAAHIDIDSYQLA